MLLMLLLLSGHCTNPTINEPTAPYCDSVWRFSTLYILKVSKL
jgi:hypothetical protein